MFSTRELHELELLFYFEIDQYKQKIRDIIEFKFF